MVKRTFIALVIPISNQLLEKIETFKNRLEGLKVKWIDPHNLHITLSFLGDTTEEQVDKTANGLIEITKKFGPLSLSLRSIGAFKSLNDPQSLWIGVEAEKSMHDLQNTIRNMLLANGLQPDKREFQPHLTLGRIRSYSPANNLQELVSELKDSINETHAADTLIYFESNLTPAGAIYKPIKTYRLK